MIVIVNNLLKAFALLKKQCEKQKRLELKPWVTKQNGIHELIRKRHKLHREMPRKFCLKGCKSNTL